MDEVILIDEEQQSENPEDINNEQDDSNVIISTNNIQSEEIINKAVNEIEDSLKSISDTSNNKKNKNGNNKKTNNVKITEKDVDDSSDEELFKLVNPNVKSLYKEFSSFLEQKTNIVEDSGVKVTIPTGIDLLDTILGGGFAIGTMAVLVGSPGSGKSMLAMQALGNAQKHYKGNMLASFLDSEQSTTTQRLSNLGVRYPRIRPYGDITIEKLFAFLEGQCVYKETNKLMDIPSVVVLDSLANTMSQKEQEVEDVNSTIGLKAKILSRLLPKYITKCSQYNICFVVINQLRDLISIDRYHPASNDLKFMTSTKSMSSGNAMRYNAFHLAELKIKGVTDPEKNGFKGIIVSVKMVKNKLFPPNIEMILYGDFVRGFSNFWTNYNFLTSIKRIDSSGAWMSMPGYPKKFYTKNVNTLYQTDIKFKESFDIQVKGGIDDFINQNQNLTFDDENKELE